MKYNRWTTPMVANLWNSDDFDWVEMEFRDQSGGLLFSWQKMKYKLVNSQKTDNWIWCKMQLMGDSKRFNIINVYAPRDAIYKRWLWHSLKGLLSQ